jgi:hypothetical protein
MTSNSFTNMFQYVLRIQRATSLATSLPKNKLEEALLKTIAPIPTHSHAWEFEKNVESFKFFWKQETLIGMKQREPMMKGIQEP